MLAACAALTITVLPVSGTDGAQVLQCADRRPFYFRSLRVGAADP